MKKLRLFFFSFAILLMALSAQSQKAEYIPETTTEIRQEANTFYRTSPKPDPFLVRLRYLNAETEKEMADKPRMVGRLYIPEQDIYVALYDCIEEIWDRQYAVDMVDSACYFSDDLPHIKIADHVTQDFYNLTEIGLGQNAYVLRGKAIEKLVCVAVIDGHNTGDNITDSDYNKIDAVYDYICYTCINGWRNIRIVGFESLGYVPTENNTIKIFVK